MSHIGEGYGSEWHLLRYMGRHRKRLDDAILQRIGTGREIDWLEFDFDQKQTGPDDRQYDKELEGLDFLFAGGQFPAVEAAWRSAWPQTGSSPHWDAVGWHLSDRRAPELLLVEAKAHKSELQSNCGATSPSSCEAIQAALAKARNGMGIPAGEDWTKGYYQYANRLAALWFLLQQGIPARLVFIYFHGDCFPGKPNDCPKSPSEWDMALDKQDRHLGLPLHASAERANHPILARVHDVFLSVNGK